MLSGFLGRAAQGNASSHVAGLGPGHARWLGLLPPQPVAPVQARKLGGDAAACRHVGIVSARFPQGLAPGRARGRPGPIRMALRALRVVLQLPEAQGHLHALCQLLVDGAVPGSVIEVLGAANMTPLAKGSGGVRPLAVGEVLRRVTARAVCMQCRDYFEEDLSPHQFAVGFAGGCEAILKFIDVRTQEDPDSVVVAIDVRNAYNSIL